MKPAVGFTCRRDVTHERHDVVMTVRTRFESDLGV